jgi:ParB family chromosome partitioning protein
MNTQHDAGTLYIPLSRLRQSDRNVRKVKAEGDYRKQLKANLLAEGVLQNLIVAPLTHEEGSQPDYEVGACGNRLDLLQELAAEQAIPADYMVPCLVTTSEKLVELSLSESIHAQIHPADEFTAYKALVDQGAKPAEIARRFGRSAKSVEKLLKLASVAPEIIGYFRAGKIDLDGVMAFTVSDDHERQLACWKEVCKGHFNANRIRQFLLQDAVESDDPIAKFVGLKAYKAAGGAVTSDLFSSEQYLLDVALLNKLATEALAAAAANLESEGWKWHEISLDYQPYNSHSKYTQLQAEYGEIPEALTNTIAEKEKRMAELEEKDFDELTPEESEEQDRLSDELSDLDDQKDNYRAYTPEQKACAGCIVTFNSQGSLWIVRGLVKKEDRQQAAKLDGKTKGSSERGESGSDDVGSTRSEPKAPEPAMPISLKADLDTYHAQAFQAELMNHERLAFELLVFTLATEVLSEDFIAEGLSVSPRAANLQAVDIDRTPAAEAIAKRHAELPVLWNAHKDDAERFKAFRELGPETISKIKAYCVARLVSVGATQDDATCLPYAAQLMQFDITRHWYPTTANYFSRINKDELLAIGEQINVSDFKQKYGDSKKKELAAAMEKLPEIKGWVPAYLRAPVEAQQ